MLRRALAPIAWNALLAFIVMTVLENVDVRIRITVLVPRAAEPG